MTWIGLLLAIASLAGIFLPETARDGRMGTWAVVFLAISIQSVPFLVLGVVISGALGTLIPVGSLHKVLPKKQVYAVPLAGLAGACLPGCECGSVPIARRLVDGGVGVGPALTFLLAAPAVNPVVLISTSIAFNGNVRMVAARFIGSFLASVLTGFAWLRLGKGVPLTDSGKRGTEVSGRKRAFVDAVVHDALHAGGFLIAGAAVAATIRVLVPNTWMESAGNSMIVSVVIMATLAILLSICSEADAFVAASLTQFSLAARLVFLVVGPAVDLKLAALHYGTFGRKFAVRFTPLALVSTIVCATIVGKILL